MWKESYAIGNELIDSQHRQLFAATERFLGAIEDSGREGRKQECIDTILFLKEYVVGHFRDEEGFQKSIGYPDREEHKVIHDRFVDTVLKIEKKMVERDFDDEVLQEFAGLLTSWLIYHVAGDDQKITRGEESAPVPSEEIGLPDALYHSIQNVMHILTEMDKQDIHRQVQKERTIKKGIYITAGVPGNSQKELHLIYESSFACELVRLMTNMKIEKIDPFVVSSMLEVTEILLRNISDMLPRKEKDSHDRGARLRDAGQYPDSGEGCLISTPYGNMEVRMI